MNTHSKTADWIAVDWGTSRLRAWAMTNSGAELTSGASEKGMGVLAPEHFEGALLDVVSPWLGGGATDVIACGMVGSRQGWIEAPYAVVPCAVLPTGYAIPKTNNALLRVHVIPGIRQDAPADVMRGEETQIAGFLALNPGWDGIVCLPGTHTKWAQVSAGELVSFQTFMTGELFATLSDASVLKHTVAPTGWDEAAFVEAVSDVMAKPEKLAARLFSLRAENLLHGLEGDTARARLSGLLIGAELAAARPYWLGQQVAVIGASTLSQIYGAALSAQGVPATIADGPRMTLTGLTAAYKALRARDA